MDRIVCLAILAVLGVFFARKMFNPPAGPHTRLKMIIFARGAKEIPRTTELGRPIFMSKAKSKWPLPWEFGLWTEIDLFENGIVLKRYKKEKHIFFHELKAIEPFLINSLFVKGNYFGYELELKNKSKIILRSNELSDLDIFIDKLWSLVPDAAAEKAVIECFKTKR